MKVRTQIVAIALLVGGIVPASARSTGTNDDGPWSGHHIQALPVEVQRYIASICKGPPHAQHDFATYSPAQRRWRINLEYLHCDGLGEYRRGNQCMDVDFQETGAHFRLVKKAFADCGF